MSDSEQEETSSHRYQTRSRSKEVKQSSNKNAVKKKIPVEKSLPKRQVCLSDTTVEDDKNNKTSKYKVSDKQLDLGNVIGELFVTQLVEESNKLLKKKKKKELNKKEKNEDDHDLENAVNEIDSDDDSDDESLEDIEGLPDEIEYTDEEHKYESSSLILNLSVLSIVNFINLFEDVVS